MAGVDTSAICVEVSPLGLFLNKFLWEVLAIALFPIGFFSLQVLVHPFGMPMLLGQGPHPSIAEVLRILYGVGVLGTLQGLLHRLVEVGLALSIIEQ